MNAWMIAGVGAVFALFLSLIVAGCVSPTNLSSATTEPAPIPYPGARVVVALLDTGIQPYHEVFKLPPAADTSWIPELPNLEVVPARFSQNALDPEKWNFKKGQLYWFEGTRVLAISLTRGVDEIFTGPERPIWEDTSHGTMTASVVAQASPHAFIVMAEASSFNGSLEWVRDQPWIDVVSISAGEPPLPWSWTNVLTPAYGAVPYSPPAVFRQMNREGKIVFLAAGNEPIPTLHSEKGLPWVITVGGADATSHGHNPLSRFPPDIVANYTHDHVANRSNLAGYRVASGTSFSAPLAAGLAAEAIYLLREDAGWATGIRDGVLLDLHGRPVTQSDVRAALNASALHWNTTDYEARPPGGPLPRLGNVTLPMIPRVEGTPVGPWIQMGWGWVGESLLPSLVAILNGETEPPPKPGAEEYMARAYALREAYWSLPVHG